MAISLGYGTLSRPDDNSPTVEMRVGARYHTHHATSELTCISVDTTREAPFLVRDANGEERYYRSNGRQWGGTTTYMDLIAEV